MQLKMVILSALVAVLTACSAPGGLYKPPKDDQIVMRYPENGKTRTYREVRDMFASGEADTMGTDCSGFVAFGAAVEGVEFPAGAPAFVEACEEGLKEAQSH